MQSQKTTRNPVAGVMLFLTLMSVIWACELMFGLPANTIRAAILATVFSSLAVTL